MSPMVRMDAFTVLANEAAVEIPCEKRMNPHCNQVNPAEWVAYTACTCPESPSYFLWCTPCKDAMLQAPGIRCGFCDQRWATAGQAFRLIEPLNRSAA